MRVVAAPAWSAVAAEVEDLETAELLTRVFRGLQPDPGQETSAEEVVRVTPGDPGFVEVTISGRTVRRRAGMAAALVVATEINARLLGECPHFATHAAVLGSSDGVLALPAESGTGKSTLAAACVRVGFTYVSDEALVLTSQGTVVPYQRPLGLSPWSRAAVGIPIPAPVGATPLGPDEDEVLIDPFDLGRVAGNEPALRVRAVLRLRRSTGSPTLAERPRSAGVIELLRNSFNHYRDPAGAIELAHAAVLDAKVLEVTMGEPIATAQMLASYFET